MTTLAALDALTELKQELDEAGRAEQADALNEAMASLASSSPELVPIEDAAERFAFTTEQMLAWVGRGGWTGREIGGRWFVSAVELREHLETRDRLGQVFREWDEEGYPTGEEIRELDQRPRRRSARVNAGRAIRP